MLTTLMLLVTSSPAAACPVADPPIHLADVLDGSLAEISGITASRRTNKLSWVHEDSGAGPTIYALDATGARLAEFDVTGANNVDWEDMASTREDGEPFLYVADIGDNAWNRSEVTVWRFLEPELDLLAPADGVTVAADRIDLTWPDYPRNAETLLVDAANDELVIVSKASDGTSVVATAPTTPGAHVLTIVGTLYFGSYPLDAGNVETTGGAVAPNRTGAAIRTYDSAFYWEIPVGDTVADALVNGTPCPIPIASEQQGEAIAFTRRSGSLVTASEGTNEPIWRVPLQ